MPETDTTERHLLSDLEPFGLSILRHDPKFRSLFENATAGLVLASLEGEIIEINPSFCRFLGFRAEELEGRHIQELTHPEDRELTGIALGSSFQAETAGALTLEKRYLTKEGGSRWGQVTSSRLYDNAGNPTCLIAMIQDIQKLKDVEERLRASEHFWKSMLDNMDDAVHIIDAETGKIVWANASFLRESGRALDEVIARNCHDICFPHPDAQLSALERCPLQQILSSGQTTRAEHRVKGVDVRDRYLEVTLSPIRGDDARLKTIIYASRDVTRRRRAELEAEQLTYNDTLTGLGNRAMIVDQLTRKINSDQADGDKIAVFMIDIDQFKKVNKTLGHAAGDELLQTVAMRLRQSTRRSDTVARLGGDEFAIIAAGPPELRDTAAFARKLLDVFKEPFNLSGLDVFATPCIGIALYPHDGLSVADLLKNADLALEQAKQAGLNTYRHYSAKPNCDARNRLMLENDLRRAIDLGQLFLVYQPQIDIDSGRTFGVEALVRWQHPEHGLISPARFIPLAEESGYILPLSAWILRTACAQASAWRRQGLPSFQLAVNLSGCQFRAPGLVELVKKVLAQTGLPAASLELELTETILMDTGPRVCGVIEELKRLGVHIAIDDFGTGYSSLAYLKNFAADRIKIAREFICDLEDKGNRAIVETMLAMGGALGMHVLAEGVETQSQLDFLALRGCREVQGFYFSKPLPDLELPDFLASTGSHPKVVPISNRKPRG